MAENVGCFNCGATLDNVSEDCSIMTCKPPPGILARNELLIMAQLVKKNMSLMGKQRPKSLSYVDNFIERPRKGRPRRDYTIVKCQDFGVVPADYTAARGVIDLPVLMAFTRAKTENTRRILVNQALHIRCYHCG